MRMSGNAREAAARWNEAQAADCYKALKRTKNNRRREVLSRDASRFTRNAVGIRKGF